MESSKFTDSQPHFESLEPLEVQGATCDTFRVKLFGKLHFLKRLKQEYANDIRYQEAFRKEFETGYRLEHPHLVRYISYSDNGILMEYVDGETLTQRLACQPDYFNNRKNTDKFIHQLLDVVGYLHSHQVLHLDLKPDNILLTRISDDVKLIDLGCCYTDTFTDTTGHTNSFAAPEQLSTNICELSIQTDIYAIGKIIELLPNHHIYNKVIARCTAPDKTDRYQSVEEIKHDINHKKPYYLYAAILAFLLTTIAVAITFFHRPNTIPDSPQDPIPVVQKPQKDSISLQEAPSQPITPSAVTPVPAPKQPKDDATRLKEDMEEMIDQAYQSTISCFCDSVFPSPSVGNSWAGSSTEFHNQIIQIGDQLSERYPTISESVIRQEAEGRFQALVSYVFNKMRENGEKYKK